MAYLMMKAELTCSVGPNCLAEKTLRAALIRSVDLTMMACLIWKVVRTLMACLMKTAALNCWVEPTCLAAKMSMAALIRLVESKEKDALMTMVEKICWVVRTRSVEKKEKVALIYSAGHYLMAGN